MKKPTTMPYTVHETTPLLVVRVERRPPRYSHSRLRRCCTSCLCIILVVAVILFLLPVAALPHHHGSLWDYLPWSNPFPHVNWPAGQGMPFASLQHLLHTSPDPAKLRQWSQYYSSGPHLAGKNLSQALWTKDKWAEFGIPETRIESYDVYINYPVGHRLALLEQQPGEDRLAVSFEASLEEDVLEEDPTTGLKDRIPTFHGYSASGNVTAQYVYANFGTFHDFEDLVRANVSLEGKIALVKYGRIFRGLKVKRAQELGMVGVVIYTDPQEDDDITEVNGYKPYPAGPARQPSSVQRGSVQYLSSYPGDPTTPGYASKPGVPRQDPYRATPKIPSLPISYKEAIPLLKALNGHGPKSSDFNEYWQGGGLSHKGVAYDIGPSPETTVLHLVNEQEYTTTPIWNVIGVIEGSITDEVVILGNHRDSWIAGGASDPNGGSAILNEVIRAFGKALKAGWKPLRTIIFASWDGEEYGLVGSTEWVEDHFPWLSKANVVYLNVDVGASGTFWRCRASPLLHKAIRNITAQVLSPNQTIKGQTILDVWGGEVDIMGSGSDYTAFQDFVGIASSDMAFAHSSGDPVYHYHSNYDSFHWMDTIMDTEWLYQTANAQVWGMLAALLSESPVLAMNATDYAINLKKYLSSVKENAPKKTLDHFNFDPIHHSISAFHKKAVAFDALAARLSAKLDEHIPVWKYWKKIILYFQIRAVNGKYKLLERKFIYKEGLDNREWYKHVIFAPGRWTGYSGAAFPGLVESFEDNDLKNAEKWRDIIKSKIDDAANLLK
ncbi:hypothetical protein FQN57_005893 [Myotisia sp. PD_48]|nr:hypothetical protein FQN57_005893 [Myotisia sp. PD_48]